MSKIARCKCVRCDLIRRNGHLHKAARTKTSMVCKRRDSLCVHALTRCHIFHKIIIIKHIIKFVKYSVILYHEIYHYLKRTFHIIAMFVIHRDGGVNDRPPCPAVLRYSKLNRHSIGSWNIEHIRLIYKVVLISRHSEGVT